MVLISALLKMANNPMTSKEGALKLSQKVHRFKTLIRQAVVKVAQDQLQLPLWGKAQSHHQLLTLTSRLLSHEFRSHMLNSRSQPQRSLLLPEEGCQIHSMQS